MKWKRLILVIMVFGMFLALISIQVAGEEKRLIAVKIQAASLKNSFLGEPLNQELVVYLPPSYYSSQKHYPVVYYLHGFSCDQYQIASLSSYFNDSMQEGTTEFIAVGVNGRNLLGGSFYVNSPVTGNWEDYVINDAVPYVDSAYRTIPKAESRGIAGWSMGGFGAINLGFKHPNVFSVVYALAPGLFAENGLREAFATWDSSFLGAYGAAFSPNLTKKDYPYSDCPQFNNSEADNIILANWENGYGNLKQKIAAYLQLKKPLKAIQIIYGRSDEYPWIPKGCVYFSHLLKENGISHELKDFPGGHDLDLATRTLVPFFAANLKKE